MVSVLQHFNKQFNREFMYRSLHFYAPAFNLYRRYYVW